LGIPALLAAGMYQAASQFNAVADGAGWAATIIGTITAFIVSYIVVSWLLRFIAHHSYMTFIWYRIGFGVLLIAFLSIGIIPAV
jgi:undecaprenyl-diphosphatase